MKYILSPKVNYSGNVVTADRIASFFDDVKIVDKDYKCFEKNDIIIGLNAYKVGKLLINRNYNFFIIVTGTDLNCDFFDQEKKKIILEVFKQAKKIIVFNLYQKKILLKNNFNSIIIPQSVDIDLPTNNFNLRDYLNIKHNISKIFLLVGNLRKVKDPFFLIDEFKKLYDELGYIFIYIGSNLDNYDLNKYYIKHIDGLDSVSTYTAIKQSNGLINTSLSEGMASSILEAMSLKCPIYARINNSNEYIIKHNYNGYLFKDKIDFLQIIEKNSDKNIIENAFDDIKNKYSKSLEKSEYVKLFK